MLGLLTGLAILLPNAATPGAAVPVATTPIIAAQAGAAAAPAKPAAPAAPAAQGSPVKLSEHAQKDISRHRAMAQAHTAAAQCLESGKTEEVCHKELQTACKGLAIGKYCGMRHEH
jgi:hypothetical protein